MNNHLFTDAYCYYLESLFDQCLMELSINDEYADHEFRETETGLQLTVKVGKKEVYKNEVAFVSKRRMIEIFLFDAVKLLKK